MDEKKQIEGLVGIMRRSCDGVACWSCERNNEDHCWTSYTAEQIYNAGYQRREWISVEDELPKDRQKCLIYTMIHFTPDHVDDIDYFFGIEISQYTTDFGFLSTNGMYARYWMPLPEAPVMKGGAE